MTDEDNAHKEKMNSLAYQDVLDLAPPRYRNDKDYMKSYEGWKNVSGGEKRFDPYYSESDYTYD